MDNEERNRDGHHVAFRFWVPESQKEINLLPVPYGFMGNGPPAHCSPPELKRYDLDTTLLCRTIILQDSHSGDADGRAQVAWRFAAAAAVQRDARHAVTRRSGRLQLVA